jgi:polysaccharide pyruvyl transferase WcaK-like protein
MAEAVYRKVYQSLNFIAVREPESRRRLEQLGINATAAFDCLPLYVARHAPPATTRTGQRVVMAGCVELSPALVDMLVAVAGHVLQQGLQLEFLTGANAWLAHDDVVLLAALHARLRGRYTLVAATSESQWLGCIAGAELLVSGRFHHSIAAACLGTPLLLTGSNTPKNEGLLTLLGLAPERVRISPAEPAQAITRLEALLRDPALGRTDAATLGTLRDLASRNFLDLPGRA